MFFAHISNVPFVCGMQQTCTGPTSLTLLRPRGGLSTYFSVGGYGPALATLTLGYTKNLQMYTLV